MFVNRRNELDFLEKEYAQSRHSFVLIYGRRRVGKTELIKEFIKNKPHIYFLASQEPSDIQLSRLVERVASFFKERPPIVRDWMDGMDYIGNKLLPKKIVLAIDEFPYLVEENKSVPSYLQTLVDEHLKGSSSMLILSGSSIGIMESIGREYKSPLFGRRTGQIDLPPFNFAQSRLLLQGGIREAIEAYSLFGDLPMYLSFYDSSKGIAENLLNGILQKNAFLFKEPDLILRQEFREPASYMAILTAVARGHTTLTAISGATGIPSSTLPVYLSNLIQVRLLEKETPVTEWLKKGRHSLYKVSGGLFNFWFRFVEPNLSDIETAPENFIKLTVMPELPSFVSRAFEEVCREYVGQNLGFGSVGRWWYKEDEIDIVGLDKSGGRILFGECKWQDNVNAEKEISALREKSKLVHWGPQNRAEEFCVFARSFSKPASYAFDLKKLDKAFPAFK